jgi:hypothetical protein
MARQLDYPTVREIFTRFQAAEPEPKGELEHVNAFTLLVAVALSAQATDAGVNKATRALFAVADSPAKMLALGEEALTEHIRTIGLFRTKAKNVMKLSRILAEEFGGEVPSSRAALQSLPGVMQVFPFENRGQEIGVTLHHPHGQIYAYPFVTPRTQKLLSSVERFGENLFADTLEFEQKSERTLIRSDNFTAYVPFAGRWPIEIHLLPHRHVQNLAQLTADERTELASVYRKLLGALDDIYETPTPYIAAWHQAPLIEAGKNVRLQLQITSPRRAADKLKYLAGSESAMGAFIADFPPEKTAAQIREALEK